MELLKVLIARLALLFLVLSLLTWALVANADFLELQEVSVDYKNFGLLSKQQRSLLTNPDPIKEGLDLQLKNNIIWGLGYFDTNVQSATSDAQYRYVGLELHTGFHVSDSMDLGLYHLSQHGLDRPMNGIDKFPSANAVELKVYLYKVK